MIIEIEGVDGCGKHTQAKKLYEHLTAKGYKCKLISFPNYESGSSTPVKMYLNGDIGENMDCLDPYQACAIFAVDRLVTMKQIENEEFDFIILDRYVGSLIVHHASRIDNASQRSKYIEWVENLEYNVLKIPRPDKVLFLDMPIEMSLKLKRERTELKNGMSKDIMEEDEEKLIIASNSAKKVAETLGWIKIDCGQKELKSIDEIHEEILTKLGV